MGPLNQSIIDKIFSQCQSNASGELASYIPELALAERDHFAVSILDLESSRDINCGRTDVPFTLQSVSKPFTYLLLQQHYTEDFIRHKIGVEPSGEAFNSIVELEKKTNRPHNPMINSGAIAATALLFEKFEQKTSVIMDDFFSEVLGREITFDQKVFESEKATAHRNRSITHLLRHFGIISTNDIDYALDLYFRQCSYLVTAKDLALMGGVVALFGRHPKTNKQVFEASQAKNVLNLMFTCGMYDSSGEWAYDVGLASKSGVSGGIVSLLPQKISIATYSPLIDSKGHSLRGMMFIKELAQKYNLSLFSQR